MNKHPNRKKDWNYIDYEDVLPTTHKSIATNIRNVDISYDKIYEDKNNNKDIITINIKNLDNLDMLSLLYFLRKFNVDDANIDGYKTSIGNWIDVYENLE